MPPQTGILSIASGFAYVVDITDPLTLVIELSCLGIAQAVASAALDSCTGVSCSLLAPETFEKVLIIKGPTYNQPPAEAL